MGNGITAPNGVMTRDWTAEGELTSLQNTNYICVFRVHVLLFIFDRWEATLTNK